MTTHHTPGKLPPLAGLCTFDEAQRPGLPVEECVRRLKRYHYSLKRLHQVFNNRIPSEPVYELKMTFSLHAYYCAEHVAALRLRISEMREPPLGLESVPDDYLEILFDEIIAAPTTGELLLGVYETALPALRDALQRHLAETNPLADHPSVRVIRFALPEIDEMIALGQAVIDALRAKGHTVKVVTTLGAAQAIGLGQAGKPFTGSPDPRGRGVFGVIGK